MRTKTRAGLTMVGLGALVLAWGCGGDEAPATEAPAAPTSAVTPPGGAAPTEAPTPGAAASLTAEDAGIEDAGTDAGPPRPEVVVPPYAPAAAACVPHPELAEAVPTSVRDLSRGVPEFPEAQKVNANCAHTPAALAEAFNGGGLRRHRTRDYVQSEYYFAQALIADQSQLSPRFNLACAMARQDSIDAAIEQLRELSEAGPEGQAYADRAHTDADFRAFHNNPRLAGLLRGLPPAIEALPNTDDRAFSWGDDESFVELRNGAIVLDSEQVWQAGVLEATDFQAAVLAVEPDRRRFSFFISRPSTAVTDALGVIGMRLLARPSGWTPSEDAGFVVLAVSSRDEDRHTLYIARVLDAGSVQPVDSMELPAVQCAEGVEPVRSFVVTTDHRAFGSVTGCMDADPHTFQRCLYYFEDGAIRRRCGQGTAAPAAAVPGTPAE